MTQQIAMRTCGVRVDPYTMDEAVDALCRAAAEGRPCATHLVNAYTLSLALRDDEFKRLLNRGDLNLPDGTPVVWAGRRAGVPDFDDRVPGRDLVLATADVGRERGMRHYLYGASPEVVEGFASSLRERFAGIEIVGVESPPYRPLRTGEEEKLVDRIRSSNTNIVWVGLGTPKQDQFVDRFRDRLPMPLVAVGAAFDFIAGAIPHAPMWMQEHGLEWVYRLAREPRRLWKRYLIGNAVFLAGVARGVELETRTDRP